MLWVLPFACCQWGGDYDESWTESRCSNPTESTRGGEKKERCRGEQRTDGYNYLRKIDTYKTGKWLTYAWLWDVLDGSKGGVTLEAKLTDKPWCGELGHIQAEVWIVVPNMYMQYNNHTGMPCTWSDMHLQLHQGLWGCQTYMTHTHVHVSTMYMFFSCMHMRTCKHTRTVVRTHKTQIQSMHRTIKFPITCTKAYATTVVYCYITDASLHTWGRPRPPSAGCTAFYPCRPTGYHWMGWTANRYVWCPKGRQDDEICKRDSKKWGDHCTVHFVALISLTKCLPKEKRRLCMCYQWLVIYGTEHMCTISHHAGLG